jgi:hypothetical protein
LEEVKADRPAAEGRSQRPRQQDAPPKTAK